MYLIKKKKTSTRESDTIQYSDAKKSSLKKRETKKKKS